MHGTLRQSLRFKALHSRLVCVEFLPDLNCFTTAAHWQLSLYVESIDHVVPIASEFILRDVLEGGEGGEGGDAGGGEAGAAAQAEAGQLLQRAQARQVAGPHATRRHRFASQLVQRIASTH